MKIYTSYYANIKNLDEDEFTFISISRTRPQWLTGVTIYDLPVLHPHCDLLTNWKMGNITWKEYAKYYMAQLRLVNPKDVYQRLCELSNDKDVVLLCWEGRDKPCHRHLIGPWLGQDVKEI